MPITRARSAFSLRHSPTIGGVESNIACTRHVPLADHRVHCRSKVCGHLENFTECGIEELAKLLRITL